MQSDRTCPFIQIRLSMKVFWSTHLIVSLNNCCAHFKPQGEFRWTQLPVREMGVFRLWRVIDVASKNAMSTSLKKAWVSLPWHLICHWLSKNLGTMCYLGVKSGWITYSAFRCDNLWSPNCFQDSFLFHNRRWPECRRWCSAPNPWQHNHNRPERRRRLVEHFLDRMFVDA